MLSKYTILNYILYICTFCIKYLMDGIIAYIFSDGKIVCFVTKQIWYSAITRITYGLTNFIF